MKAKQGSFMGTFHKTLGIIAPFLLIGLLFVIVVYLHDNLLVNDRSENPAISQDNNWSGLKVSVDVGSKNIYEPKKAEYAPCDFSSIYFKPIETEWPPMSAIECSKKPTDGKYYSLIKEADKGSVIIRGNIYLKNRRWFSSTKIPTDLIQLKYGDNQLVTSRVHGFTFGQFLGPRKGVSGTFEILGPYGARDGILVLRDGDLAVELK